MDGEQKWRNYNARTRCIEVGKERCLLKLQVSNGITRRAGEPTIYFCHSGSQLAAGPNRPQGVIFNKSFGGDLWSGIEWTGDGKNP